jgi:hypothetical protein
MTGRTAWFDAPVNQDLPARAARVRRGRAAERLGGFIYGTILVLAVISAGARAYPHEAGEIAVLVAATSLVFWLAHVYAHAVAESIAHDQRLSLSELGHVARREGTMIAAAIPSTVALLLGAAGVLSTKAAVWAAFGLGLALLVLQGLTFARVERLGRLGTLAIVATNLLLGTALVGLKVFVSH